MFRKCYFIRIFRRILKAQYIKLKLALKFPWNRCHWMTRVWRFVAKIEVNLMLNDAITTSVWHWVFGRPINDWQRKALVWHERWKVYPSNLRKQSLNFGYMASKLKVFMYLSEYNDIIPGEAVNWWDEKIFTYSHVPHPHSIIIFQLIFCLWYCQFRRRIPNHTYSLGDFYDLTTQLLLASNIISSFQYISFDLLFPAWKCLAILGEAVKFVDGVCQLRILKCFSKVTV